MIKEVKILEGLAGAIVKRRVLVTSYNTNQIIKAADTYHVLKSLTTSGVIQDFTKQFSQILPACKISRKSFYERLAALIEMGFVKKESISRTEKNLFLCNWEKFAEFFEITHLNFLTLKYDYTDKTQNIEYLLKGIEFYESESRIKPVVNKKCYQNQEIQIAYQRFNEQQKEPKPFTPANLFEAQQITFSQGSAVYFELHTINPDFHRNLKTIKAAHNYKSWQSVAYLKKQLKKRKICKVEHREPIVCQYAKKQERGELVQPGMILNFLLVPKGRTQNKTTWYNSKDKFREWYLPDVIEFNTDLFKQE